jgi:signal peptidase II
MSETPDPVSYREGQSPEESNPPLAFFINDRHLCAAKSMIWTPNKRMGLVALLILGSDQLTKFFVLRYLGYAQEKVVIDGFFKFVHWGNTGAAWSLFTGYNSVLAAISILALIGLYYFREHFSAHRPLGQVALGLMFGGILGNFVDRVHSARQHVIDFIYFYVNRRDGGELGFPAFNIADSAICIGVGLLFYLSWKQDLPSTAPVQGEPARSK